jgi:hypothetical protein
MTVHIELSPTEQHQLEVVAQQRGGSIEAYLHSLFKEALPRIETAASLTDAKFEEGLKRLAQFSDFIPGHPGQTRSREALYDDHD